MSLLSLPSVTGVLGKVFGVDMTTDQIKAKLADLDLAEIQGQLAVNVAEANNPISTWKSLFLNWRRMLGFTCVSIISLNYFMQFAVILLAWVGITLPPMHGLDLHELFLLVGTMLGMHGIDSGLNSPVGTNPD